MAGHRQRHTLLGTDHTAGTTPLPGKVNLVGTDGDGKLSEVVLEATNQGTAIAGEVVRRDGGGNINLPTTNATGNQAISVSQAQNLLQGGMYRGAVGKVVPDRLSEEVTGLQLNMLVIETGAPTSTEAVWKVIGIDSGTTGALVEWANQGVPDADVIYVNQATGGQWMYSVDLGVWIDMGASSHNRVHDINSAADHSVPTNQFGVVYTFNGGVNILTMVALDTGYPTVPKGSPVISNGQGVPIFGSLLIADGVVQGSDVDPTSLDIGGWADLTIGVVRTANARFMVFKDTGGAGFGVEMGAL